MIEFFLSFLFIYLPLCMLVGVFARVRRNRTGLGWFLLAVIISPLIAGLLVAILRERTKLKPWRNQSDEDKQATARQAVWAGGLVLLLIIVLMIFSHS